MLTMCCTEISIHTKNKGYAASPAVCVMLPVTLDTFATIKMRKLKANECTSHRVSSSILKNLMQDLFSLRVCVVTGSQLLLQQILA